VLLSASAERMRNEYLRKVRSLRRDGFFVFLLYWAYPRARGW